MHEKLPALPPPPPPPTPIHADSHTWADANAAAPQSEEQEAVAHLEQGHLQLLQAFAEMHLQVAAAQGVVPDEPPAAVLAEIKVRKTAW